MGRRNERVELSQADIDEMVNESRKDATRIMSKVQAGKCADALWEAMTAHQGLGNTEVTYGSRVYQKQERIVMDAAKFAIERCAAKPRGFLSRIFG